MDRSFKKSSIIFCFFSLFIVAGNDEEFFLKGNKLYKQQDYQAALQAYEMVNHKGRAVLYNMGNCYYHIKNYPLALVFFDRAERGATCQEIVCIENNKQIVLEKIGKIPEDSMFKWVKSFLYFIFPYFSLFFLQLFFLICLYGILYGLHTNIRFKKSILVIGGVSIVIVGLLLSAHYMKMSTVKGIVVEKSVLIYSGASDKFITLKKILIQDILDSIEEC